MFTWCGGKGFVSVGPYMDKTSGTQQICRCVKSIISEPFLNVGQYPSPTLACVLALRYHPDKIGEWHGTIPR